MYFNNVHACIHIIIGTNYNQLFYLLYEYLHDIDFIEHASSHYGGKLIPVIHKI